MVARYAHCRDLLAAVLVATLTVPMARAADSASLAFMKTAIQGNLAEISVGKLAADKGSTEAVKSYGRMLVEDHNKANQDATDAAKSLGVAALPLAPDAEQQALHDRLATEPGKKFDTDLVNAMLQDHQKQIGAYEKAASEHDDAAGHYANKLLPILRKHMDEVTKLAKSMGI